MRPGHVNPGDIYGLREGNAGQAAGHEKGSGRPAQTAQGFEGAVRGAGKGGTALPLEVRKADAGKPAMILEEPLHYSPGDYIMV